MLRYSILLVGGICLPCFSYALEVKTPKPPSKKVVLEYKVHIEEQGRSPFVTQPETCGTEGESRRIEGITIRLATKSERLQFRYKVHLQNHGDTGWFIPGQFAGTRMQNRRLEAIWIEITGEGAKRYDVYYQGHVEKVGWTDWKKNGEMCGSRREKKRLEALRVFVAEK
jgi:uncharacterized protein YjdB